MILLHILLMYFDIGETYSGFEWPYIHDFTNPPQPDYIWSSDESIPVENGGIPLAPAAAGGYTIQKQLVPWHAGIYVKTTRPYMQVCGGTIVRENAIISAAHCFTAGREAPRAPMYAVAAGKVYRPWADPQDEGAQRSDVSSHSNSPMGVLIRPIIPVRSISIPPHYQGNIGNFQDDLAVVITVTEFRFTPFVAPACISFNPEFDQTQLQEGQFGKVVGWGLTGEDAPASQVLQGVTLPTISIDRCIEQSPAYFRTSVTGDKICAGYTNGTAVCQGDSGGGLVFPGAQFNGVERVFLRGIVSTAPTARFSCNVHTWATFTHLLKHEHFIKSLLPGIDLACLESQPNPTIELRIGDKSIFDYLKDERCSCACPNTF